MLNLLSGRSHEVCTGVALLYRGQDSGAPAEHVFVESTAVEFAPLPAPLIEAYVASGEPFDKAGSYGIQGGAPRDRPAPPSLVCVRGWHSS